MTAREEVLARVRRALADVPREAGPLDVPREYTTRRPVDDVPGLFAERVADYRATVVRVSPGGVAAVLAGALAEAGARRVVVPAGLDDGWLAAAADRIEVVGDEPPLSAGALDETDAVVTGAAVGIATTGTIVLDHGPGQGRRALTLVPDLHVCVVQESQVVGDVPEAVSRLQGAIDERRPLTWISGPSATSDIELDRVEGVHGPRTLHVVLVSDG